MIHIKLCELGYTISFACTKNYFCENYFDLVYRERTKIDFIVTFTFYSPNLNAFKIELN